jgi:hypothetical protein
VTNPREGSQRSPAWRSGQGSGRRFLLALTFLFVIAAVFVSAGLVVYTAWSHDLKNGLFALAFAVLSAKTALSWLLWRDDEKGHEAPK